MVFASHPLMDIIIQEKASLLSPHLDVQNLYAKVARAVAVDALLSILAKHGLTLEVLYPKDPPHRLSGINTKLTTFEDEPKVEEKKRALQAFIDGMIEKHVLTRVLQSIQETAREHERTFPTTDIADIMQLAALAALSSPIVQVAASTHSRITDIFPEADEANMMLQGFYAKLSTGIIDIINKAGFANVLDDPDSGVVPFCRLLTPGSSRSHARRVIGGLMADPTLTLYLPGLLDNIARIKGLNLSVSATMTAQLVASTYIKEIGLLHSGRLMSRATKTRTPAVSPIRTAITASLTPGIRTPPPRSHTTHAFPAAWYSSDRRIPGHKPGSFEHPGDTRRELRF